MAHKHLFVDSDILLDILLKREPFYFYTQILFLETKKRNIELNTSALVISNVHYVLSRSIGSAKSKIKIKELILAINVLSFENDIVNLALDSDFADYEDAVQYLIAKRHNCDAILTRNIRDFKNADMPVLTAEQFLKTL